MSLPDQSVPSPPVPSRSGPAPGDMRARLAAIAVAALVGIAAGRPALAAEDGVTDPAPGYPASAATRDVMPWLASHTSVRAADIIAISPQAVVSLDGVIRGSDKSAPIAATVREELIDPGMAERLHARSTRVQVELDCAASLFRIRENTRFTLPDLKGGAEMRPSTDAWSPLEEGTTLFRVAHTACGTRPAHVQAASAPPPEAIPAPAAPPAKASPPQALAKAEPPPQPTPPPPPAQPARAAIAPAASSGPAFKVLLGSYSTEGNAHVAVAALNRSFPEPMKGRDVVVRKALVNGKDYFAVAVQGFVQHADASEFCKAIHATPDACLIRH